MASRETTARHRAATNVPTRESAMVLTSDGAGELLFGSSDGPLLPLLLALSLAAMIKICKKYGIVLVRNMVAMVVLCEL